MIFLSLSIALYLHLQVSICAKAMLAKYGSTEMPEYIDEDEGLIMQMNLSETALHPLCKWKVRQCYCDCINIFAL